MGPGTVPGRWEFHSHRRPVVVDEYRVAKRLLQRSDFVTSHPTVGDKTWVLVGVELNREQLPRHRTGRFFCCMIPNRRRDSLQRILRPRLLPESVVWTDELPSYDWLRGDGHLHEGVNHEQGEFSRLRGYVRDRSHHRIPSKRLPPPNSPRQKVRLGFKTRRGVHISSNAAEGMVSQSRKHLRSAFVRPRLGGAKTGSRIRGAANLTAPPG